VSNTIDREMVASGNTNLEKILGPMAAFKLCVAGATLVWAMIGLSLGKSLGVPEIPLAMLLTCTFLCIVSTVMAIVDHEYEWPYYVAAAIAFFLIACMSFQLAAPQPLQSAALSTRTALLLFLSLNPKLL
jgi:hypothetical protein